ncbi:MAG: carbohydrate ABC transporter permease [Ktedonobacteraceae bacterium]|nr:carbohydrate ABC transporter permease [Ktedonobacteraceae bacterium]
MNVASMIKRRRRHTLTSNLLIYAGIIIVAILVLMPFIWVISLALKGPEEAFAYPPNLLPHAPTLKNFGAIISSDVLPNAFLNSVIVAITSVITNVALATLAGYAFARLRFPGSEIVFFVLIASSMVPGAVTLVPLFLTAKNFPLMGGNDLLGQGGTGLLDTVPGLLLPHVVQALNIFLARQFFLDQPEALAESARIDGASEFLIFLRVYLPLSLPMIATIGIFAFTGSWEDFLWPLVITTSPENYTIQVALSAFAGIGGGGIIDWGPLMAATVLATIPLLLAFIFFQRYFVAGLTSGSVKG